MNVKEFRKVWEKQIELRAVLQNCETEARAILKKHGFTLPKRGNPISYKQLNDRTASTKAKTAAQFLRAILFLQSVPSEHDGIVRVAIDAGALSEILKLSPVIEHSNKFTKQAANKDRDARLYDMHVTKHLTYGQIGKKENMKYVAVESACRRHRNRLNGVTSK